MSATSRTHQGRTGRWCSDDLDATLTAVEQAGGRVVTPSFELPDGRRFHFADPDGNELGAWSGC